MAINKKPSLMVSEGFCCEWGGVSRLLRRDRQRGRGTR